jgi:hypothetical protein
MTTQVGRRWPVIGRDPRRAKQRAERRLITIVAIGFMILQTFGPLFGLGPFKVLALFFGAVLVGCSLRWPYGTLRFALIWLPLSPVLLSLLHKIGLPVQLVSTGTYLRSGLVMSLGISGWVRLRASGRRLDVLDRLGLGYVAVVASYLVIGPFVESTPLSVTVRLRGFQSVAIFVIAFFAMRWLELSEEQRRSLYRWATGLVAFLAVAGLYQRFAPGGFNRILFNRIGIDAYLRDVAKLTPREHSELTFSYFRSPPRVSSLTLSPFGFADLMLCGLALAVTGMARRVNVVYTALIGACAAGIFFSDTRIAIVAMAALMAMALVSGGLSELAKVRLVVLAVIGVLALMPLLLQSRLVNADDNAESDQGHRNELLESIDAIIDRPLGSGLGSEGAITRRFSDQRTLASGNGTFSIGIQVGVIGMGVFLAFLVTVLLRVRRTARAPAGLDALLAKTLLAGTIVSSLTHNNWQEPGAGTVTWILIGLAFAGIESTRPDAGERTAAPPLGLLRR